jgi:hypothetical protein
MRTEYRLISSNYWSFGLCSTTGERDPVNSALLIILGRRMSLDIGQVVRWKSSPTDEVLPTVRYAASFAGYHLPLRDGTNYFI